MKPYAILLVVLLGWAPPASARQPGRPSLQASDPPRWDVSGEVGWLGSNKSDIAVDWDEWFDVTAGGAALGYYWTPQLRSELRVSFSGEGRVREEQRVLVPGERFPTFRLKEHLYRSRTVGAGLSWQFFENQWFHPALGGGLDLVGEREAGVGTTTTVRPFVSTGFKWYVNERAFARSDFRVSFRNGPAAHVTWTGGFGVDL